VDNFKLIQHVVRYQRILASIPKPCAPHFWGHLVDRKLYTAIVLLNVVGKTDSRDSCAYGNYFDRPPLNKPL
jgi:hypothetical protein